MLRNRICKHAFHVLFFLAIPFCGLAQKFTLGSIDSSYSCNSDSFKLVSEPTLRRLIRRDFSYLVLNRDQSGTLGTGFGLTVSSDKTEANYSFSLFNIFNRHKVNQRTSNILSLNFDAGYNEGIGTVFSNAKASPKAGVTVKFSKLLSGLTGPGVNTGTCPTIIPLSRIYVAGLRAKKQQLSMRNVFKQDYRTSYTRDSMETILLRYRIAQSQARRDSALAIRQFDTLSTLTASLLELTKKMAEAPRLPDSIEQDLVDTLVAYELKNVKWNKNTVTWIDFAGSANVEKYNLFNDLAGAPNANQDTATALYSAGLAFNQIQNWKKRLLYWKLGYRYGQTSNLAFADTYSLETSSAFQNAGETNRVSKTASVYKLSEAGSFERFWTSKIEGQAIFMFANNKLGLDVFTDLNFSHNTERFTTTGILNAGLGFILTVQDQAKEGSSLNVELFYKWKDINGQTPQARKLDTWERYDFGVKLGLPFNKVIL